MAGTRLGVMCEAITLCFFGFLLGLYFNWRLAIFIFIPFFGYGLTIILQTYVDQLMNKRSKIILEKANAVIFVYVISQFRYMYNLILDLYGCIAKYAYSKAVVW